MKRRLLPPGEFESSDFFYDLLQEWGQETVDETFDHRILTLLGNSDLPDLQTEIAAMSARPGIGWIKPTHELGSRARKILGSNGLARFQEFTSYRKGWRFGEGEPMSPESVGVMEWFLMKYAHLFNGTPGVFFTRRGNVQLIWRDAEGCDIELEFFPNHISYLIERSGSEGSVLLQNVKSLLDTVRG